MRSGMGEKGNDPAWRDLRPDKIHTKMIGMVVDFETWLLLSIFDTLCLQQYWALLDYSRIIDFGSELRAVCVVIPSDQNLSCFVLAFFVCLEVYRRSFVWCCAETSLTTHVKRLTKRRSMRRSMGI